MNDEEMDNFLDLLREGGRSAAPLDYISSGLLRDLLLHSVYRQARSLELSTSSGSPPDESGSATTPVDEPPAQEATDLPSGDAPEDPKPNLIVG